MSQYGSEPASLSAALMPCTFHLPLKTTLHQLPAPPSLFSKIPKRASFCLLLLLLSLLYISVLVHNSSPLLKATWPKPLVTSSPELNQKVIFLLIILSICLALFIYLVLFCFQFSDVDDSHCRSKGTFLWLLHLILLLIDWHLAGSFHILISFLGLMQVTAPTIAAFCCSSPPSKPLSICIFSASPCFFIYCVFGSFAVVAFGVYF